jgi:hypothetical protein
MRARATVTAAAAAEHRRQQQHVAAARLWRRPQHRPSSCGTRGRRPAGASPYDGVRILWAAALSTAARRAQPQTRAWADVRGSRGGSGDDGGAVQAAPAVSVGPAFGVSLTAAAVPSSGGCGGGGAHPEGQLLPVRLLPTLWALAHAAHPPQAPATHSSSSHSNSFSA